MPSRDVGKRGRIVQFINCRLLRNHEIITDDLWVRDGVILNPEKLFFEECVTADLFVDCKGMLIVPGFIDVQINGRFYSRFCLNCQV
jgi:N-acetylglucosamine-6-phosphate deacetylase